MNTLLLENSLNIEQKSAKHFTDNFAADNKKDFSNVLNAKKTKQTTKTDQKGENKETKTLGDVKNDARNNQKGNKIANFKEILTKAAGEISVENALNLTLKRDIGDIINQIKDIVNSDEIDEAAKTVDYAEITDIIKNTIADQAKNNEEKAAAEETEEDDTAILSGIVMMTPEQPSNLNTLQNEQNEEFENTEIDYSDKPQFKELLKEELREDEKEMSDLSLDSDMLEELNVEYIGSETNSAGEDASMNKQSPEEFGVKAMLNHHDSKNFELNLVNSSSKTPQTQSMSPDKIIEQITKQLDAMKSFAKVNIILNPASLGRVDLQVINTKEGLSAQFTVTTNEAKELLMKGLDGLKESLLAQGVAADNISVKVAETEEASYKEDWTEQEGSRGGNKEGGEPRKDEKEKGLFEKTMAQTMNNKNGNV